MTLCPLSTPCSLQPWYSQPSVAIGVFSQGVHAAISEAVLFAVSFELSPIVPRNAAAVRARPQAAVPSRHHGHNHFVGQPVGGCEHSNRAVLEPDESVAISADPQISVPIAIQATHIHA